MLTFALLATLYLSFRTNTMFVACWLVDLILNVPVNNFSLMLGRSHRFLGITSTFWRMKCLAQGHNKVTRVRIEPPTSRSGIRRPKHQASAPPVRCLCFILLPTATTARPIVDSCLLSSSRDLHFPVYLFS